MRLRCSVIFVLTLLILAGGTATAHSQTYSVLYNFGTHSGDPLSPEGGLSQGRDGNIYGISAFGGATGQGAVFEVTTVGVATVLDSFQEHEVPANRLTLGADGNFYGATEQGGSSGFGTVFKITPAGVLNVLWNFTNGSDGGYPLAPPIQGADGNFYGTTAAGNLGLGTVYKLTPSGTLTTLYQFDSTHGALPENALIQDTDGNFYGSAFRDGFYGAGTIFEITPAGKLTTIYSLIENFTGSDVSGPLIQGNDGYLYATTFTGGPSKNGTAFKISPEHKLTKLRDFSRPDGTSPYGGLIEATDGNFYGVAVGEGSHRAGTIYRITASGSFSVLHNFDNNDGSLPYTTLLQHTDGKLYGTTSSGGSHNGGVFYSLDIGLGPFAESLPTSGKVGATVKILGTKLMGTTAVNFNGTAATFTVVSETEIKTTVPSGATTGFVTVTTPSGKLKSNKKFRITG